ncbi:MAG TPA: hypothetical protein DDZ97_08515 [Deltaproteobacteria bacterium]|nr:hypothetical protein [Deltaproteobacteria bacterium]
MGNCCCRIDKEDGMAPKSCQKRGLVQGSLLIPARKEGVELLLGLKNSRKDCTDEMRLATHHPE